MIIALNTRPVPVTDQSLCFAHVSAASPGAAVPYGNGRLWLSNEHGQRVCHQCAPGWLFHERAHLADPSHARELLASGLAHTDAQTVRTLLAAYEQVGTEELASLVVALRAAAAHPERADAIALRETLALLLPAPAQTADASPEASQSDNRASRSRRAPAAA